MRIDDARSPDVRQARSLRGLDAEKVKVTGRSESRRSEFGDEAASSSSSGLLALALQLNDTGSSSRVDQLRSEIEAGTYQLDFASVSRAMLNADRVMD